MKILILAPGSRGDVEPALRIASGLIADGHEATIVAHADYEQRVTAAGCELVPFAVPLEPPLQSDGSAPGARGYLAHLRTYMLDHARAALAAATDGGFGVVITNPISPYGHDIAEALSIPSAEALPQPGLPSRSYPPMIASNLDLGPALNRGFGRLVERFPAPVGGAIAHVRGELGLPKESRLAGIRRRLRAGLPVHHGISPSVLPRPSDWPNTLSLDGFWWPVEDENWTAPSPLVDFLAAGPAPVLITLGSVDADAGAGAAVAEFAESTDRRVIVQGKIGENLAEAAQDRVFAAEHVPHSWLLPQVAAVVHQAGAGITAASLRAGTPGVPLPLHTDQFFWARRAHELGAAVTPLTGRRLSRDGLKTRVDEAIGNSGYRRRAAEIGARLDDGDSTAPLRRWAAACDG
ncbi:glycosyltransferase [Brevibacterium sediminis]|uniref:glycosyltransferase n=1 Tax=Brevibacterium sediminis TaxID=1857024 RepID=UPI0021754C24|nr:glycosyltransferase [Brevibacterium sediminis]MCS4592869.1 glycosyltransferase [Brevibacterium sediminis]